MFCARVVVDALPLADPSSEDYSHVPKLMIVSELIRRQNITVYLLAGYNAYTQAVVFVRHRFCSRVYDLPVYEFRVPVRHEISNVCYGHFHLRSSKMPPKAQTDFMDEVSYVRVSL
jgi:hypothetical protein